MQRTFPGFCFGFRRPLPPTVFVRHFSGQACQCLSIAALLPLLMSNARAQAVWSGADDRNNYEGAGVFRDFWSYAYVAPDQNGNGGHAGNWSGNLAPGQGGPTDVYLGAPGGTLFDVNVTLNSLTLAPGGSQGDLRRLHQQRNDHPERRGHVQRGLLQQRGQLHQRRRGNLRSAEQRRNCCLEPATPSAAHRPRRSKFFTPDDLTAGALQGAEHGNVPTPCASMEQSHI